MKGVRWFRRVRAGDAAAYEAVGWRRVARDWSDSVGELALMEWAGGDAPGDLPVAREISPNERNPMLNLPSLGARVRVWPALGVRVQDGPDRVGQFLSPDGREVEWDAYWHRRYLDGAIHLHDPRPATSPKR